VDSFLSPENILGENLATAFYYCDYADVQTLDPSSVFLSIAKQVRATHGSFFSLNFDLKGSNTLPLYSILGIVIPVD
jgi:hypothetical protein